MHGWQVTEVVVVVRVAVEVVRVAGGLVVADGKRHTGRKSNYKTG